MKMPVNWSFGSSTSNPGGVGVDFRCDQMSSVHSGGAHCVMADGSVRFLSESMAHNVRKAIASRGLGEAVGDF